MSIMKVILARCSDFIKVIRDRVPFKCKLMVDAISKVINCDCKRIKMH